jgi:orotate phosphoribosyltransferase
MLAKDIKQLLSEAGALLEGHFLLRSGLHSNRYFQAALALQYPETASELATALTASLPEDLEIDTVVSPAVGGIVFGQEMGRAMGSRAIFAEKDEQSELHLRRGFSLKKGERVLIAEDVITRGGRVQQTIDLVKSYGVALQGVAVLVDRSAGKASFDVPTYSLIQLELETYSPESCPLCAKNIAMDKPGS